MCSCQKKTYHNVARQSPLIFSIFLHQISCRRVQSIFETTSTKSEACPTMPCISLVIIKLETGGLAICVGTGLCPATTKFQVGVARVTTFFRPCTREEAVEKKIAPTATKMWLLVHFFFQRPLTRVKVRLTLNVFVFSD